MSEHPTQPDNELRPDSERVVFEGDIGLESSRRNQDFRKSLQNIEETERQATEAAEALEKARAAVEAAKENAKKVEDGIKSSELFTFVDSRSQKQVADHKKVESSLWELNQPGHSDRLYDADMPQAPRNVDPFAIVARRGVALDPPAKSIRFDAKGNVRVDKTTLMDTINPYTGVNVLDEALKASEDKLSKDDVAKLLRNARDNDDKDAVLTVENALAKKLGVSSKASLTERRKAIDEAMHDYLQPELHERKSALTGLRERKAQRIAEAKAKAEAKENGNSQTVSSPDDVKTPKLPVDDVPKSESGDSTADSQGKPTVEPTPTAAPEPQAAAEANNGTAPESGVESTPANVPVDPGSNAAEPTPTEPVAEPQSTEPADDPAAEAGTAATAQAESDNKDPEVLLVEFINNLSKEEKSDFNKVGKYVAFLKPGEVFKTKSKYLELLAPNPTLSLEKYLEYLSIEEQLGTIEGSREGNGLHDDGTPKRYAKMGGTTEAVIDPEVVDPADVPAAANADNIVDAEVVGGGTALATPDSKASTEASNPAQANSFSYIDAKEIDKAQGEFDAAFAGVTENQREILTKAVLGMLGSTSAGEFVDTKELHARLNYEGISVNRRQLEALLAHAAAHGILSPSTEMDEHGFVKGYELNQRLGTASPDGNQPSGGSPAASAAPQAPVTPTVIPPAPANTAPQAKTPGELYREAFANIVEPQRKQVDDALEQVFDSLPNGAGLSAQEIHDELKAKNIDYVTLDQLKTLLAVDTADEFLQVPPNSLITTYSRGPKYESSQPIVPPVAPPVVPPTPVPGLDETGPIPRIVEPVWTTPTRHRGSRPANTEPQLTDRQIYQEELEKLLFPEAPGGGEEDEDYIRAIELGKRKSHKLLSRDGFGKRANVAPRGKEKILSDNKKRRIIRDMMADYDKAGMVRSKATGRYLERNPAIRARSPKSLGRVIMRNSAIWANADKNDTTYDRVQRGLGKSALLGRRAIGAAKKRLEKADKE